MTSTTCAAVPFLVFAAVLLAASCQPAVSPMLRNRGPFTCEPALADLPCIVCLKKSCCAPATACNGTKEKCPCWLDCLAKGNAKACAEKCTDSLDRAMAECSANACATECPGGGPGGTI